MVFQALQQVMAKVHEGHQKQSECHHHHHHPKNLQGLLSVFGVLVFDFVRGSAVVAGLVKFSC